MFSRVYSGGLMGIDGYLVQVEADVSDGLPGFYMVGYLASEVREAEQRVRTAMKNSGFQLGVRKITVNLSPANVRKEGTAYDLPVAVAVMTAYGMIDSSRLGETAFIGELGLDGVCKPIRGVLPLVLALRDAGIRRCFLPAENVTEGLAVSGMGIVKVEHLKQLVQILSDPDRIVEEKTDEDTGKVMCESSDCGARDHKDRKCEAGKCDSQDKAYDVDFSEIQGQLLVRRATEVAVAGMHNILYIGPPGSGKSMIARRIPTIMPSLEKEEQLEISKVYSICGMLPSGSALMKIRPYRAPHHTISPQALVGGGTVPRPGEISLASRGVLFLDELPEFQKGSLEILRQPMEERRITVSRLHGSCDFPAHFMLAAAMNPCPCGYYPDRNRCSCTEWQVKRYLGKISRPLLDRVDVCVEAAPVTYQELKSSRSGEPSAAIRRRVEQAREIQRRRFEGKNIFFNGEMGGSEIREYCELQQEDDAFLQQAFQNLRMSARGCHRVLRVARTIADLDGAEQIQKEHLCEAIGYRSLEGKYWGGER